MNFIQTGRHTIQFIHNTQGTHTIFLATAASQQDRQTSEMNP